MISSPRLTRRFIVRRPLLVFYALVFAAEWALSLLFVSRLPAALFSIALLPTPLAFLAAALTAGRQEMRELLTRSLRWRLPMRWYWLALLIPTAVHLLAAGLALLLGGTPAPRFSLLLAYGPLTLILAAGEEVGWHGYAFPHLRRRLTNWQAALTFGTLHAAFHLPMFVLPLPVELRQASPFPLFLLMAVAFAFYRVWLFDRTDGNVPLAIVYHTAINTSVILVSGVGRELVGWLLPVTWAIAVLPLFAAPALAGQRAKRTLTHLNEDRLASG